MNSKKQVSQFVVESVKNQLAIKANRKTEFSIDHYQLDFVEVIMSIEKEFSIVLGDEQCTKIETVGQLVDLTQNEIKNQSKK